MRWHSPTGAVLEAEGNLTEGDGGMMNTLSQAITTDALDNLVSMSRRHKCKEDCSLRKLEYLSNNYSKVIEVQCGPNGSNLHLQYILYQKTHKRHHFGAFCRKAEGEWIPITLHWKGQTVRTSIAQLNFFRFISQMNVMEWLDRVVDGKSNHDRVHEHRRRASTRASASRRAGVSKRSTLNPGHHTPAGRMGCVMRRR